MIDCITTTVGNNLPNNYAISMVVLSREIFFLISRTLPEEQELPPNLLLKSCFVWYFGTRKTFQKLIKAITKFFGPFWIQVKSVVA